MLPQMLYEALPFAYILAGVLGAVFFDSIVIFIAALLLVLAGVSVIIMRRRYRRERHNPVSGAGKGFRPRVVRSERERRQHRVDSWPVVDCNGDIVRFNRRKGERRRVSMM